MSKASVAQGRTPEDQSSLLLSIIIPAYNEEKRLPKSLRDLQTFLADQPYAAEVIVVDDGSTDGTAALVEEMRADWPILRLVQTPQRGKGHAVREGLLVARGSYSFFCDADFSMPVSAINQFLPPQLPEVELAIATREGPQAHRYGEPFRRHVMGRVFNNLVRWLALPGIQDSQCGFKCIRADIGRQLAAVQTIDSFGFDVELLFVARAWGYDIIEIPIDWYYSPSPNIRPLRDSWRMTRDLLLVRRNARAGSYPHPQMSSDAANDLPATASTAPSTTSSAMPSASSTGLSR